MEKELEAAETETEATEAAETVHGYVMLLSSLLLAVACVWVGCVCVCVANGAPVV